MTRLRRFGGRGAVLVLGAVVLVTALGACGDSDPSTESKDSPTGGAKTTTTQTNAAAAYVGLTKAAAIARAEAEGRPWRIGREDDEQFMLTQDFVDNRVTFEIDDGEVTKATLG